MCAILNASRADGPRIKYQRSALEEEEKDIMTKLSDIEKSQQYQAYVPINKKRNKQTLDDEATTNNRLGLLYGKQDTLGEIWDGILND